MAGKRDSKYLVDRIAKEHPGIHADLLAGKYRSVRQAAIAAGLQKEPTALQRLKREWKRAGRADQKEFIRWIAARVKGSSSARPAIVSPTIVDTERRLLPVAAKRIEHIMKARGLRMGQVMKELGFKSLDASLGLALVSRSRIKPELIIALKKWLADNARY